MSHSRSRWIAASVLVVALVGVSLPFALPGEASPSTASATAPPVGNDAGSGKDAGDTPASALVIGATPRPLDGNLNPPGVDLDWFVHGAIPIEEAFCIDGSVRSNVPSALALTWSSDRRTSVSRHLERGQMTHLVLAAPASTRPFLGLEPASTMFATSGTTSGPTAPGHYTFDLSRRLASELDPEADGESPDGGPTRELSVALPGDCFAGRLDGVDAADHFHVDVTASARILVSLADAGGAPSRVDVLSPTGAVVASLVSGEATTVYADAAGRWTFAVTAASGPALAPAFASAATVGTSDYLLSVMDDPGSTNPCRPTCVAGT